MTSHKSIELKGVALSRPLHALKWYFSMFTKSTTTVGLSAAIVLIAATAACATIVGVPTIDIQKRCKASQISSEAVFGDKNTNTYDSCVHSNQQARDQLIKDWATISASDRASCVQPNVFSPSYFEWLTCIEMARDVRRLRTERPVLMAPSKLCPLVQWRPDGSFASAVACQIIKTK